MPCNLKPLQVEDRLLYTSISTHPHDLVEASIGDVGVALAVDGQAVRHVEHVLAGGADDVTGVWIQDHDGVFFDHLPVGQGPVRIEGSGEISISFE